MNAVCLYLQVHQPWRLRRDFNFFHIGADHRGYSDESANASVVRRVAERCYLPANRLMLELVRRHAGRFRLAFSITGTAIDQFEAHCPEVLDGFRALVDTGCVELIGETYHHSLAFLHSRREFREQVLLHRGRIQEVFGATPTSFRNTELIYTNELAREVEQLGYQAVLTEGADKILGWRSPNFVYMPKTSDRQRLLLKNHRLSDDLAFRFGDPTWSEQPLTAPKYASWIHRMAGNGEVANLFMDYQTFGEQGWAGGGIFKLLDELPAAVLAHKDFRFLTPAEVAAQLRPMAKLDVPQVISWADEERDTTAWLGNPMQGAAAELVYALENPVKAAGDAVLLEQWRRLLASDHFYYMCTKWFSEGDSHRSLNPYSGPHDAFVVYSNIVTDLRERLKGAGLIAVDA